MIDLLSNFPVDYLCYGDSAYPKLRSITRGEKRAKVLNPLNLVALENSRRMSKVRECVKRRFSKIVNLWAFLNFSKNLQMFSSPISSYYTVMAFLTNCHTFLYGG